VQALLEGQARGEVRRGAPLRVLGVGGHGEGEGSGRR
jgi:hypothetical protein